ncbi:MAG: serine/threonine protein kinase [Labilithrix sp.]|nr:serine/threonine protein kinase [Labilithrix sp.]
MSSQVPAIGTLLVNRYELVKELGRGGCAIVFEAHDHRLSRMVAVKIPIGIAGDTAKMGRFAREARVIASIHHPNVCAVLDSGFTEDGAPFLVMERLFGESLRATINRAKQLGVGEAIAIGLQLLSALDAVHAAGIVHRDIKPDNVILVSRGGCDPLVKLLDFGLCRRAARRRDGEDTMTCDGAIVGTPEYMAPEQVLGSTSLDVRVDIYAVGVVLYEALTGERAFLAKTVRDILSGVMNKRIRPLREVRKDAPRSLEVVVARAMDRDPARRPQTASELQDDLVAVKEEMAAAAQRRSEAEAWELPTTRFVRRPPPPRRPMRAPNRAS